MKIETQLHANFQSATIEKDTPVISLLLTADCFSENNPKQVAVLMLYTDLLLSGAGKYNRDDFLYAVDELGSGISLSEREGRVTISLKTLAVNLNKTLKLFELMLAEPTFKEVELKRAIETTINSLVLYKEDSKSLAHDALRRILYDRNDRHFDFTPDEIIEELNDISVAEIKRFHDVFINAYWIVSVGGNSKSIKETLKLIEKIKKSKLATAPILVSNNLVSVKGRKISLQSVASKQNIDLSIGSSLPLSLSHHDMAPFTFGLAVLGKLGGFAGRLMSTVREKEGLTYGIYAKTEGVSKTETGYWRIMTFFAPKDVVKGVTSTLREINKIYQTGITQSESERFKNILKTGEVLVYDSLTGTVGLVHSALVSGMSFDEYKEYRERLYSCSRTEVNRALKKYLDPSNLVISGAGPVDSVSKDLKKLIQENK
jgi:zinc protease